MNNFVTQKVIVPIDKVAPNPWNPNFMSPGQFSKEKDSIQKLGLIGSIFVREYGDYYQILDGEHRWKVCKELGYTEIPVENIGPVSDADAQFYTVHMNNTRGQDDVFKRAALFKLMSENHQQMLPFTSEQIENEKSLITFDFSQYEKESELPERTPGLLIVLPFSDQESQVWLKAKEELVKRDCITTDNTKKKQDIQAVMYLIKNFLGIVVGVNNDGTTIPFEKLSHNEPMVQVTPLK